MGSARASLTSRRGDTANTPRARRLHRLRRCGTWLLAVSVLSLPHEALAQSAEEFEAWLARYAWFSAAATGVAYAALSFVAARGRRWRLVPAFAELVLVSVGTLGVFWWERTGGQPFVWLAITFLLEPVVLGATLLRARREQAWWLFVLAGWWLLPIVLWLPGMLVFAPLVAWLAP